MRRKSTPPPHNFYYLKIFLFFVIILIFASLAFKSAKLVGESSFKNHSFTLMILGGKTYLLNVDKNVKRLSVLKIQNFKFDEKNLIVENLENKYVKLRLGSTIGIPIDGILFYRKSKEDDKRNDDIESFEREHISLDRLLSIILKENEYFFHDLNTLDFLKIYLISISIPRINKQIEHIDINSQNFDVDEEDKQLFDLFKDSIILNEKTSIEVVNAAGVDGLGAKISRMLKNEGFNIVSISSDEQALGSKIIFRIEQNNAIKRLGEIFKLTPEYQNEISVVDVSIIIGKDVGERLLTIPAPQVESQEELLKSSNSP